jgi:hypothetical protein
VTGLSSLRDPVRLTRRSVLRGAAVAGAASLVAPAASLAEGLGSRRSVFGRWVGELRGESPVLSAARRFVLVGVQWAGPAGARIELRARATGGHWSPWMLASERGHGPDVSAEMAVRTGEPIWTGVADLVQVRSAQPLHDVRLQFVSGHAGGGARAAQAFALAQPVLDAGPGQPPIITRSAWANGARPRVAPSFGTIKLAFVHHTDNANDYAAGEVPAMLLAIYDFHRYVRGWDDIGYNFVIDAFGRIWEARAGGIDQAVIGAQAGGYNAVSTGVAMLGTFNAVSPSRAAIDALERLLAWKLALHGVPSTGDVTVQVDPAAAFYTPFRPGALVSLPRVAGHRDGDSTDCPGNVLYGELPAIRPAIAQLTGSPASLTLNANTIRATAPHTIALTGRLALLSGEPLAGAAIELQNVTASGTSQLASTTTAPDGSFTSAVTLRRNANLRALHRSAPASVSDIVAVQIAPALQLRLESTSPLRVSGSAFPASRSVEIDLYLLTGRHRRLLARNHATVRGGRFDTKLAVRRPGHYIIRAVTRASAANAGGASNELHVVI